MGLAEEILNASRTAFLDDENISSQSMRPKFISNDATRGRKVVATLEDELRSCDSFTFSVAFVTSSGITPLLETLKELEQRGIPGQIVTTDYLCFSEPRALKKLNSLSNIEIRMYKSLDSNKGFHTKGFLFKRPDGNHRILIGSSNLTQNAISTNQEWNVILSSASQGEIYKEVAQEFDDIWRQSVALRDYIDTYEALYKEKQEILSKEPVVKNTAFRLEPNSMQIAFINRLDALLKTGAKRGLLISATGTGKTYAAAFAMRHLKAKRVLFLVHREQVLRKSIESFRDVLGSSRTYGLVSGNSFENKADFVFATMQTMSKDRTLKQFDPDTFDVVIIDEAHRTAAASYQNIMEYFTPKFFFGMTASPDRPDAYDIYDDYDNNIIYEIRLQTALSENLLCPFHYFGVTDISVDGFIPDDKSSKIDFQRLVSEERVNQVMEKAEYYGHCGERVKGLIFCSRNEEAEALSAQFNSRGWKTLALSGSATMEEREDAVARLELDKSDPAYSDHLDYILSVDVFNEGIDVPAINQVIMLRPTSSPIIFIQQLGRGLRLHDDKEYLVVIDFIGNYENNYLIPVALSGDRTYNKDAIRRYVLEGSRVIPGASSMHFEEIARQEIFKSIDKTNTGIAFLKAKYFTLKNRLGRIPSLCDMFTMGEIDPSLFSGQPSCRSYFSFLKKYDEDAPRLTQNELKYLEYLSRFVADGVSPYELLLLKGLLKKRQVSQKDLEEECLRIGVPSPSSKSLQTALRVLNKDFQVSNDRNQYEVVSFFSLNEDDYSRCFDNGSQLELQPALKEMLQHEPFREAIADLVEYGLSKYRADYFPDHIQFRRYAKYSRSQVCRLLN